MDLAAFIAAVSRRTRFTSMHRDQLLAAKQFIAQHGATAEGRALLNVLKALAAKEGEFDESELYLFSTQTLTLVKALAEARVGGMGRRSGWDSRATGRNRPAAAGHR